MGNTKVRIATGIPDPFRLLPLTTTDPLVMIGEGMHDKLMQPIMSDSKVQAGGGLSSTTMLALGVAAYFLLK